jgi:PAS domain S-box-containing protein
MPPNTHGSLRQAAEDIVLARVRRAAMDRRAWSSDDVDRAMHDLQVHQIELEMQNEELRRTQDALEASRARYFDLYDLAPVGYFTLDARGIIIEANLTGASLLGVTRGALVGTYFSRYIAAEDCDTYYLRRNQLGHSDEPQAFELRLLHHDKTAFTAWTDITVAHDDSGTPMCRLVATDISDRKAIQEKLRESQSLLHAAGQMAHIGGWAVELPHLEISWSDEVRSMLDYPKGYVPQLADVQELYPRTAHTLVTTALSACMANATPFDFELDLRTAKRRSISVRVIGQAVRNATGAVCRIEGAVQDITAGKKATQAQASLEAQLRESQKMEAIGTLAAGIAHDFNNILGTILGNADLARKDCGWNHHALESLDEIKKAGRRAQDLVQQILSFSRRQPTARRVISLQPIVDESVRLMRAVLPGGVRLDCHCSVDAPAVAANPTQVKQVLLNLGTNAAHAMRGQSGDIVIRVESFMQEVFTQQHDFNLRPGHYARIVFSDSGHGMDQATQKRIFEPFFTTKPVGEGTGLGLSVVHGIMQNHAGAILVSSAPGKGSRFELYFPTAGSTVATLSPHELAGPSSEGAGQKILYLDDDESQLFMVKRMMERWGYSVVTYREQREAIEAVKAGEIYFELVITDFKMPGMSGLDVARALRDLRPELPVLMVSGYINDPLRAQATAAGVRELFSKPHEEEDLRDAVQLLLPPPTRELRHTQ